MAEIENKTCQSRTPYSRYVVTVFEIEREYAIYGRNSKIEAKSRRKMKREII